MSLDLNDDDKSSTPRGSRRPLLLLALALILVAAFLGGRVLLPLMRGSEPAKPAPAPVAKATAQAPSPVAAAPAPAEETPAPKAAPVKRPRRKEAPPAAPAAPAAPTTGELRISSDVPGAMVFLDRIYLGPAPVTAPNVTPGVHKLNVSADGLTMASLADMLAKRDVRPETAERVRKILEECDLVRFAPTAVSPEMTQALTTCAKLLRGAID
jgi:hypothetical protein